MRIHEAIEARTAEQIWITRRCWEGMYTEKHGVLTTQYLIPTDSADNCVVFHPLEDAPIRCYALSADDLTANDWHTVRYEDLREWLDRHNIQWEDTLTRELRLKAFSAERKTAAKREARLGCLVRAAVSVIATIVLLCLIGNWL